MAYEDELNQETVELEQETEVEATAETAAEEPAPQAEQSEAGLSPELPQEEKTSPEPLAEEPDEDLLTVSQDEEMEIEFEVDPGEPKTKIISQKVQQVRGNMEEKYSEAREACKTMMDRLADDLKQTNYNPYIRTTITRKYEILRSSSDTEPVDVFEFEKTSGFSLRAMAITTALVTAADIAVGRLLKKRF